MVDELFSNPTLASVYDLVDGPRDDLALYEALVEQLGAQSVIDVGCGTGALGCRLARRGLDVTGIDPAHASLDVARGKPDAERVRWVHGDAAAASLFSADVITMTGNVAQVFLTTKDWYDVLTACRKALASSGHLVFETRRPERRAWEHWTPDATRQVIDLPDGGQLTQWTELLSVEPPLVSFRHTYVFSDGASPETTLTSDSTLRFRELDEIEQSLRVAGFTMVDVLDAPDRPGLEYVVVAQAVAEGN